MVVSDMKLLYLLVPILIMGLVSGYTLPATTFAGNVTMNNHNVVGLAEPSLDTDAATKLYTDTGLAVCSNDIESLAAFVNESKYYVTVGTQSWCDYSSLSSALSACHEAVVVSDIVVPTPVSLPSGTHLQIVRGSVISCTAPTSNLGILNIISATDVSITGDGVIDASHSTGTYRGLYTDTASDVYINGITVRNSPAAGVVIYHSTNVTLDRVHVYNSSAYGIQYVDSGGVQRIVYCHVIDAALGEAADLINIAAANTDSSVIVDHCSVSHSANLDSMGINVAGYGIDNVSVFIGDNIVRGTRREGIHVMQTNHSVITGNSVLLDNTSVDNGITSYMSNSTIVKGNTVKNAGLTGIVIAGSAYCSVVGNTITRCLMLGTDAHSQTGGVLLLGASALDTICNSVIGNTYDDDSGFASYGIGEWEEDEIADVNYNCVVGNSLHGCAVQGVITHGVNTINDSNMLGL